jgi:basic membrane lipoprotein Med (substrate-binding protein (PBP1-ABC) superfamily)
VRVDPYGPSKPSGGNPVRRTLSAAATAVIVAVAATVVVGCGAIDKALDCANTAVTVAESVEDLQNAASSVGEDPTKAKEALDSIEKNLDEIEQSTDSADVKGAVGDLNQAVADARTAVNEGRAPDMNAVNDAASKLTEVCSPA